MRAEKNHDFDEVEDQAYRGDEQSAACRDQQRRRRDDEDVQRREGRAEPFVTWMTAVTSSEIEDRLRVEEARR